MNVDPYYQRQKCRSITLVSGNVNHFYTVSQKRDPDIIDCNFKRDQRILTIFGINIPETTGHQMAFNFPPHPTSASTLLGENRTNEILHFIQGNIITLLK